MLVTMPCLVPHIVGLEFADRDRDQEGTHPIQSISSSGLRCEEKGPQYQRLRGQLFRIQNVACRSNTADLEQKLPARLAISHVIHISCICAGLEICAQVFHGNINTQIDGPD